MSGYSYSNTGGTGDRTASITVTTTATVASGTINNLVDGAITTGTSDAFTFTNGESSKEIKFDFGSGKVIKQARWYQNNTSAHGTWKWQGSNDDSSYTDIGTTFTLGGVSGAQVHHTLIANTTSYRYYKLLQTAGTVSGSPACEEIEFFIFGTTDDEPDTSYKYDAGGGQDAGGANPGSGGNSVDRTAYIIVTSNYTTTDAIDPHNLIDGAAGNNGTDSISFPGSGTGQSIIFDFSPTGFKHRITEIMWEQSNTSSQDNWDIDASDDGLSWTNLASNFSLVNGSSTNKTSFTNATAYVFYRLIQHTGSGGTSNSPWIHEIYFKCAPGTKTTDAISIPLYANAGGNGDRTTGGNAITITTDATAGDSNTISKVIDGATTNAYFFAAGQNGKKISFDFGSGTAKVVREIKWKQSNTSDQKKWQVAYSDDGSSYTNVGVGQNIGGTPYSAAICTIGVPLLDSGHRYWKMTNSGGMSSNPNIQEIEFALYQPAAPALTGTWASTEAKDVFAGAGGLLGGSWASTEAKDMFAGNGSAGDEVIGSWASTEAKDVWASYGSLIGGAWASTEAKDLMSSVGYPALTAAWASIEAKDTFAFSGHNLAIDGHANNASSTSSITSGTVTLTTSNPHDVIVVCCTTKGGSISSITDVAGLTWTKRTKFNPASNSTEDMEIWWAHAPTALVADVITIHFSTTNGFAAVAFGVSGANTGAPFDTHNANSVTTDNNGSGNPSRTITTDFTGNQIIFGFLGSDDGGGGVTQGGGAVNTGMTTFLDRDTQSGAPHAWVGYANKAINQTNLSLSFTQNGGSSNDRYLMADAIIARVDIIGTMFTSDTKDTFSGAGYPQAIGSWHSTEAKDVFGGTGTVPPFGTMGAVEAKDAMGFTGEVGRPLGIDTSAAAVAHDTNTCNVGITTTVSDDVIVIGIIVGGHFNASSVATITDTAGLTWKRRHIRSQYGTNPTQEIWWAKKHTPGATTITVTTFTTTGYLAVDAIAISGARANAPWDTHTGAGFYNDNLGSGNPTGTIYSNSSKCMGLAFYGSDDVPSTHGVTAGWTYLDTLSVGETSGKTGRLESAYQLFSAQQFGATTITFGQVGGGSNNRCIMQDVIVSNNDTTPNAATADVIRWFFDGHGNQMILAMSGTANSATKELTTYNPDTTVLVAAMVTSSLGARVLTVTDSGNHSGWAQRSIETNDVGNTSLELWWVQMADPFSGTVTVTLDENVRPGDIIGFIVLGINGPDLFLRGEIFDGDSSLPAVNHSDTVGDPTVGPFSTLNENVLEIVVTANQSQDPTGFQPQGWLQFIGSFFGSVSGELVSHSPLYNIALQAKFSGPVVHNDSMTMNQSPNPASWLMLADALPVGPVSPPQGVWGSTESKDITTHTGNFTAIGIASPQGWVGFPPNYGTVNAAEAKDRTTNPGTFEPVWDTNGWIGFLPLFISWDSTEFKDVWHAPGWVLGPTTILARWESVERKDSLGFSTLFTWYTTPDSTGDRTSRIIVTTNASLGGSSGTPDKLVNGLKANNAASAIWVNNSQAAPMYFRFDFGTPKVVNEATWFQNGTSPQPGQWIWQGSNNGTSWDTLSAPFTLDAGNTGAVIGNFSSNGTEYRFYQVIQTTNAGGNDLPWLWEINFKVAGFSGTMGAAEAKDGMNYQVQLIPTATPIPARKRRLLIVT